MSESPQPVGEQLEQFRAYLRLLARVQVGPLWQAKVDASDVVQQTLLDAWRGVEQYRGKSDAELAGWLRAILARRLAHTFRDLRREKCDIGKEVSLERSLEQSSTRLEGWLVADQSSPSERVERNEQAVRVASAVEMLPENQREVLLLHYWHGWTLPQIGKHLGRTQPAVAGLLHRGLKTLRRIVGEGG